MSIASQENPPEKPMVLLTLHRNKHGRPVYRRRGDPFFRFYDCHDTLSNFAKNLQGFDFVVRLEDLQEAKVLPAA